MEQQKSKPMPNIHFKIMSFLFRIRDFFNNPAKRLEKLGVREGQTLLDFGCGPGSYTIPAARMVGLKGRIYALDIHPLAIQAVERKANKNRLTNITTILSDRDTGLTEGSVDVVLLYDTIHAIEDKTALLEELQRVMKSSGVLSVLAEHINRDYVVEIAEKDGHFYLRDQHGRLLNFNKRVQQDK